MNIVILSGGVGSRLWPISRKLSPKPFMKMPGGYSILQNTFLRAIKLLPKSLINVTNLNLFVKLKQEFEDLASQCDQQLPVSYILEPFTKNTAAAIASACLLTQERNYQDQTLLVLPSDHFIVSQTAFQEAVTEAVKLAEQNRIVTFGIKPHAPEIGYGYIKHEGNTVKNFIEKPSIEKAYEYFCVGDYLWNSGMFCFKASVMLEEMAKYCPDIISTTTHALKLSESPKKKVIKIDAVEFAKVREESIDYAVMEKSDKISVVPCDIGWSDIGNWQAMRQLSEQDSYGNVINASAVTRSVKNCYIEGHNRLIAAVGIENLAIIDTPDALLVVNQQHVQEVKAIYQELEKLVHPTHLKHSQIEKPWGNYQVIARGENYKVKRLEVNPGASLSLQSHQYRSEYWMIMLGTAKVINNDKQLILHAQQTTHIAIGAKHKLSNASDTDKLVVLEIQTGTYLEEDDIKRFDVL